MKGGGISQKRNNNRWLNAYKKSLWLRRMLIGFGVGSAVLFVGGGVTGILSGVKIIFATVTPVPVLALGIVFLGLGVLISAALIGYKFFGKAKKDKAKATDKNQNSAEVVQSSEHHDEEGVPVCTESTSQVVLSTLTDTNEFQRTTSSTPLLENQPHENLKTQWERDKGEFREFVSSQQARLREHFDRQPSIEQPQEGWHRELQTLCNSIHEEMKKRYRTLCLKYHSDKNPEQVSQAEEAFKELQSVYDSWWKKHIRHENGQIMIEKSFLSATVDDFFESVESYIRRVWEEIRERDKIVEASRKRAEENAKRAEKNAKRGEELAKRVEELVRDINEKLAASHSEEKSEKACAASSQVPHVSRN